MGAASIERLDAGRHDRSGFSCGDSSIDRWLAQVAVADATRTDVAVFVATADEVVVGYYRLSVLLVERGWQPAFGDGSDEVVPAIQLSRLGVDHNWQRQGLGSSLVLHAVEVFSQLTAKTDTRLLVAKAGTDSEQSAAFCRRFGFRALDSAPGWSYLVGGDVLATVAARR